VICKRRSVQYARAYHSVRVGASRRLSCNSVIVLLLASKLKYACIHLRLTGFHTTYPAGPISSTASDGSSQIASCTHLKYGNVGSCSCCKVKLITRFVATDRDLGGSVSLLAFGQRMLQFGLPHSLYRYLGRRAAVWHGCTGMWQSVAIAPFPVVHATLCHAAGLVPLQ